MNCAKSANCCLYKIVQYINFFVRIDILQSHDKNFKLNRLELDLRDEGMSSVLEIYKLSPPVVTFDF